MSSTTPGYHPNLSLPATSRAEEPATREEIQDILNAFITAMLYINTLEERIAVLEQYNIDFP